MNKESCLKIKREKETYTEKQREKYTETDKLAVREIWAQLAMFQEWGAKPLSARSMAQRVGRFLKTKHILGYF